MIDRISNQNFSERARRITTSSTTPSSSNDGDLWYKTDTNSLLLYDNGSWVDAVTNISSPSASGNSIRNVTISTSNPTGGSDGDIWMVYS